MAIKKSLIIDTVDDVLYRLADHLLDADEAAAIAEEIFEGLLDRTDDVYDDSDEETRAEEDAD